MGHILFLLSGTIFFEGIRRSAAMSPLALRILPSINEDSVEIFRPGSPNLLDGLPEGIKREPTPFYKKSPTIIPTSPTKLSPSKKRKVGSPRPAASKKSPTPTFSLPLALALKQVRPQPQPQIKPLPALQPSRSNKENGLQFTVTRNAIGAIDPRRPLRRSNKDNEPSVKRMDINSYREVLRTKEKLDEEKRAKASPDDLDDDLMMDIDDDDTRPYDKVRHITSSVSFRSLIFLQIA